MNFSLFEIYLFLIIPALHFLASEVEVFVCLLMDGLVLWILPDEAKELVISGDICPEEV
jgi:hypothetical protein